jgi:galactitol-specific phosphotransferase system IIB component
MKIMKINAFLAAACSALVVLGSGCVGTNDGHSTFGLPFVRDTRPARYQRTVEQVAAATRVVLTHKGKLLMDNVVNNTFKAKVNERDVWVKITKVDEKFTDVQVQVRTRIGGDIDLASDLDKEIALQLTVTP